MKALLRSHALRVLAAMGLFTFVLPACRTDAETVCDDKCNCEGCSNQALDNCYSDALNQEREANAKGCLNFYDDLQACQSSTGFCKSGKDYETSCKTEKERYDNCKK